MAFPKKQFPNVTIHKSRHGVERFRFRKTGFKTAYFSGELGSPEFLTWYDSVKLGETPRKPIGAARVKSGTISELCVRYYSSVKFDKLSPSTKTTYRRVIERFRARVGDGQISGLERKHINAIILEMKDTPHAADNMLKRIKMLMGFALNEGMITTDPSYKMEFYNKRTDGFRTWTEQEIAQFKEHFPSGSKERLALALLLNTAARSSDVARLGWNNVKDNVIQISATKTHSFVAVPIGEELRAELDVLPKKHITLLMTEYGKPYSVKGFQQWFAERALRAGLGPLKCKDGKTRTLGCHGLRKASATRLANAGCNALEIAAVTGHKNLAEVEVYIRERDQVIQAQRAFERLKKDG